MGYFTDKLVIGTETDTDSYRHKYTRAYEDNDNTQMPKLAPGKN